MGSDEKFCLRWNDFESNISVAFREIREEKDFFDCTISVGDRQIQAHKLILSACSPFFRSVLRKNPHQHPLLYLKGVGFSDIQYVLNFMYHGEVNVSQEELNSFLAVAEDLKVKGLTQNNSINGKDSAPKPIIQNIKIPHQMKSSINPIVLPRTNLNIQRAIPTEPPAPKRSCPTPDYTATTNEQDDDDIQEVMPVVKTEPGPTVEQSSVTTYQQSRVQTTSYSGKEAQVVGGTLSEMEDQTTYEEEDGYDYGDYEEDYGQTEGGTMGDTSRGDFDQIIKSKMSKDGGIWFCSDCDYSSSKSSSLVNHVEAKHVVSGGMMCDMCQIVCPNRQALKMHYRRKHKNAEFS